MERKKNKKVKLHVKKGDMVSVIAGNDKGSRGEVLKVDVEKRRAYVKNVNMVTKHVKPSANNPQGERYKIEASIHVSNLMVVDPKSGEPRRSGRKLNSEGKLERYFKEHTSRKK